MRKSALFVLVFIMALSAFSIGVGLSYNYQFFAGDDSETVSGTRADDKDKDKEKEEEVKDFKVKGVHYRVKADGEVEVDDKGTDTTVIVIPKEVTYKKKTYKVTSIVEKAFYQNKTLKSVTIEGGGTVVPKQAFEGCTLTTLKIGEGFKSIDEAAFKSCTSLSSVEVGTGLQKIGESAFEGNTSLASVKLPDTLEEIEKNAFKDCTQLATLEMESVSKKIAESAFENCSSLTTLKLTKGPEEIEKNAFKGCSKLEEVEMEQVSKKLAESAFENCTSLTKFKLTTSPEEIEKDVFKGCTQLAEVEFGTGLKKIGESVFEACENLKTVKLPDTLEEIEKNAFKDCTQLEELEMEAVSKKIGESAFENCKSLTKLKLTKGPEEIEKNTFKDCSKLEEVEIESDLKTLGDSVFEGCSELKKLSLPKSFKEMGKTVLKDCKKLEELLIKGNLDEITKELFEDCESLTTIEIEGDVKLVEDSVFMGNEKLKTVKLLGNVEEIGKKAFKDCEKLETFEFKKNKEVKKIGESAFENCKSLKEMFIPGSLEIIEKKTFKGCVKLEKLEIETGVKEIGESAFEGCSSLEEVTIPGSVKKVGEKSFKDCTKLKEVKLEEGVENIGKSAFEGCGDLKMVTIPASVKEIGESVFEGSSLEEMTIPASTKVINASAFKNSLKLKKVKIEDGVEEIGDSAFVGCVELEELTLPKTLKKIGKASFGGCKVLKQLVIPDKVEEIGKSAFKDCEKIDSLLLGEGLKEIGDSAFYGCKKLPRITLPKGITTIAKATFKNCEKVDSLHLPDSLKSIGESAFEGLKKLPKVILPKTVNKLEKAAFKNCDSLKWVQVEFMEPFEIDLSVFEGIHPKATLKVPKGTRAKFLKSLNWVKQFYRIIGGEYKLTLISKGFGIAMCPADSLFSTLKDSLNSKRDSMLTVRNDSIIATYYEGDSILITFTADKGYQIKDIAVNDTLITDSLFSDSLMMDTLATEKPIESKYFIKYLDQDMKVAVEYEKIHYRLTIVSIGQGYVGYDNQMVEDTTMVFRIEDGQNATVTFSPGEDWRVKSVTLDSTDITSEIPKYTYTIKNIKHHTKLVAEYEVIPDVLFILAVYAQGNGEVRLGDDVIRDNSKKYYLKEGTDTVLTILPDDGYSLRRLRVNGTDMTSAVVDNQYTVSNIKADVNINISFETSDVTFAQGGINYIVTSQSDKKVVVTPGDYGQTLEVPATVTYGDQTWQVDGIQENALETCDQLTAVIWNPEVPFSAVINNPNVLLYVKDAKYVRWAIPNVVVNGIAPSIVLTEAQDGNDFHCPKAFKAESITFTHNYKMETGFVESRGWETIALPFDVQKITHATAGEIVPFKKWSSDSEAKPFWLYELTSGGYQEADGIKANTPYLISMPNHSLYKKEYRLAGKVTFSAENVEVKVTDNLNTAKHGDRTLVPNFINQTNESFLALNVNNDIITYRQDDKGSKFVKGLRSVHPFEAYMLSASGARSISVGDDMTTSIKGVAEMKDETQAVRVYDLRGVLVKTAFSMKEAQQGLERGIYVINGKKTIIK